MPIRRIPFLYKKHRPPTLYVSKITRTLLHSWDKMVRQHELTTFPSPLTPLFDNPEFGPGMGETAYPAWRRTECQALGHLFDPYGIIPFPQLKIDYGLPESERLRYFQLRPWAMHSDIRPNAQRYLTPFEKWLITRTSDKKLITDLYRLLQTRYLHSYHAGRTRWDNELGRSLTNKEWEGACYRARHTTCNVHLADTLTKLVIHWYYTPDRLHKLDPTQRDDCWRGCGQVGTLIHVLWDCSFLQAYWKEVLTDIDKHLDTELPRLPEFVLLGVPNPLTYPLRSKRGKRITLALGAAVQNVLRHWKTQHIPTHTGWLHRLWHIMGMEKMSLALAGKGPSFEEEWGPLLNILQQEFQELSCP